MLCLYLQTAPHPFRCAASTSKPPPPLQVRCLYLHTGRVNELSFDSQEEHIASCSDDCTVAVRQRWGRGQRCHLRSTRSPH